MIAPEALALGAAACFAGGSLILGGLKGAVPLLQLARWQLVSSFAVTAAAALVLGGWHAIAGWQAGLLLASGMVGITLASLTYFGALYAIGPRLTALLFTLTAPFSVLLGLVFLGETVTPREGGGIVLVLAGVVLAIGLGAKPPGGPSLLPGILMGIVTALGQAVGSLLARPAMAAGVEPFAAMAIRTAPAAAILLGLALVPALQTGLASCRGGPFARAMLASLVGTALGMTLLMAALEQGDVGIVSTLSSITPVLILPMLWALSGERPAATAWAGAVLAVSGVALISL